MRVALEMGHAANGDSQSWRAPGGGVGVRDDLRQLVREDGRNAVGRRGAVGADTLVLARRGAALDAAHKAVAARTVGKLRSLLVPCSVGKDNRGPLVMSSPPQSCHARQSIMAHACKAHAVHNQPVELLQEGRNGGGRALEAVLVVVPAAVAAAEGALRDISA